MDEDDFATPISPDRFMRDVAVSLIERDMLMGILWRVPYTLTLVLDIVAEIEDAPEASDELKDFVRQLVVDIVETMMYAEIDTTPTEEDIDAAVSQFGGLLDDLDRARLQKNEEQEDNQ